MMGSGGTWIGTCSADNFRRDIPTTRSLFTFRGNNEHLHIHILQYIKIRACSLG
jgi:hypothetical protein